MANEPSMLHVSLFYSYSHKDIRHKNELETILATLKSQGFLKDWDDTQIMPGQSISRTIRTKIDQADIVAFLLSPAFLDSAACVEEWNRAKARADSGQHIHRVPIIIRECPWQDFLAHDDIKALPMDGTAVSSYEDSDVAWLEVYEGIKTLVESLRTTYTPKLTFRDYLSDADVPSSAPITLEDIFVFPHLVKYEFTSTTELIREETISSIEQLRDENLAIVHGEEKSGKTALAKHVAASLINDGQPVLFADSARLSNQTFDNYIRTLYEEQFHGDYYRWNQLDGKTLIVDNMGATRAHLDLIVRGLGSFSRVFIFVSTDIFRTSLIDDIRLADFVQLSLKPVTRNQQQQLIRKRLQTIDPAEALTHGAIDRAEDRVDSIIISNKIVPRYPFFILAILETYDQSMPRSLAITSYGHCYYVFILASFLRAGISESDDEINSAWNFAEHLAFATFLARRDDDHDTVDFQNFQDQYHAEFIMDQSIVDRLTDPESGLIAPDGEFRAAYTYYFLLGKRLATNSELAAKFLPELCRHSYTQGDYLTLLFAIHHASDGSIIEDVLLMTMVELDDVDAATLSAAETSRFAGLVAELPKSILSASSVDDERAKVREAREELSDDEDSDPQDARRSDVEPGEVRMLRVLKNNRILGQVLRNQYGKLPRNRIEEIVEAIADSSFRLVNVLLKDEEEIRIIAHQVRTRDPEASVPEVQRVLSLWSFLWTMMNIEAAVHAVNVPGIREAVRAVVERNATPAYEIFGYFYELDSGEQLTPKLRANLEELLAKHSDIFVRLVLSIRTQWYINTHESSMRIEQSICALLGITYKPRPKLPGSRAT